MLHFLPNSPPTDKLLSSPPTDDGRSPITEKGLRGVTETPFRGCPRIGGERNTVSRWPPGAPPQHPWGPWATPEGIQTRFGVPGGVWRPWATPEGLQTRFGVSGGVWRPCATPTGLQRAPDTSRRPPQVRSGSHKLAPVQVTVDGEAVRFRNLCPNAWA